MRKLTAILLLALALVSCMKSPDGTDGNPDGGHGVKTEAVYVPPEEGTSVDGIFAEDYLFSDGKFYFQLKYPKGGGGGVSMLAYSDLQTGVSGIVCEDPLCTHGEDACRYADMDDYCFTDDPGVYYGYRFGSPASTIWLVDLNTDTVKLAHTMDSVFGEMIGYSGGKLYFYDQFEDMTDEKKTITEIRISCLDHETQTVTEIGYVPEEVMQHSPLLRFMRNGEIYYSFSGSSSIYRADPEFQNISAVFEPEQGTHQWYIDDNTDAIYYLVSDQDSPTGAVYIYKNGTSAKVELPHEGICSFSINGEKIYYTVFDPVYYGISSAAYYFDRDPDECKTYDYTGGKVYAVSRENPSGEAELVYASGGFDLDRLPDLDEFIVIGDYLYFDEVELRRDILDGVEYLTISHASDVQKIRVGLKDGSFTRIKFE